VKDVKAICDHVRQTAYDIHVYHGHGHLEKVYENALAHRLRKAGLDVKQQYPLKVQDEDGTPIGDYLADLLVEELLVIELKTAKALALEPSAAEPQPKSKQTFHHEGREEHEVRN
jgi:GxxExxY protein